MAEKKKEEKKPEAKVEEALAAALSEDLGEIPPVSITVEELKRLERTDRKKRRLRNVRFISGAVAAVVVCAMGVYMVWPQTAVPVDADKNTQQQVEEGDGIVIINEGDAEGEGSVTTKETNWDDAVAQRRFIPELVGLQQNLDAYIFQSLEIENQGDGYCKAIYTYKKKSDVLYIEQEIFSSSGTNTSVLNKNAKKIETNNGTAYIVSSDEEGKIGILYTSNSIIKMLGNLQDQQFKDIFNSLDVK